jgi:integrase/recombinase XerD
MKTYVEPIDIAAMKQVAKCLRDRLLIGLLFHLGCRVSEALGLTVDDIDLSKGTITIIHLKTRLKILCPQCGARLSKYHAFCPRCGIKIDQAEIKELEHRKTRTLPIDVDTLSMLKDYIERGGPVTKGGRKMVFGINRHRAWQVIKQCAEKAGLPRLVNPETGQVHNVSPHRLRDAFAVHAVKTEWRLLQSGYQLQQAVWRHPVKTHPLS